MTLAAVKTALPGATQTTAALFLVLWAAKGRFVGYDGVSEGMRDYTADYPSTEAVRATLKRLRAALRASGWPVQIETGQGIGLRLVVPAGWHWAAPGDEFRFAG